MENKTEPACNCYGCRLQRVYTQALNLIEQEHNAILREIENSELGEAVEHKRETLTLHVGGHYLSRDNNEWVCCAVMPELLQKEKDEQYCKCIRAGDGRIEWFYPNGIYSKYREREHDLLSEIK